MKLIEIKYEKYTDQMKDFDSNVKLEEDIFEECPDDVCYTVIYDGELDTCYAYFFKKPSM